MRKFLIALIAVSCMAVKCNPNTLAIIEAVISAAEVAAPALCSQCTSTQAQQYEAYLNSGMDVIITLTSAPITAASLQNAATAFRMDIEPILPSDVQPKADAIALAITNFLVAEQQIVQSTAIAPATAARIATIGQQLSTKQVTLRTRAIAVKTRIANKK